MAYLRSSDYAHQQHLLGTVRHYYGDAVRALFVAVAVMTGIAIPLSGELRLGVLVGAPVIVVALVLAGLTNPHGKTVLILNTFASGLGVVLSQLVALNAYAQESFFFFGFVEILSLILMSALYFSVKNVRAMAAHKIGQVDEVGEFDESNR